MPQSAVSVLVLTDITDQFTTIKTFVEQHDFQALQAKSVREVMHMLRDHHVVLFLARVETLGHEIADCIKRVKRNQPEIGLILLTPATGAFPLSKTLELGADASIATPLNEQSLALLFQRPYWEAVNRLDWWENIFGDDSA